MMSSHAGRNQAAARWHRLDQHSAPMVSGQVGRNQDDSINGFLSGHVASMVSGQDGRNQAQTFPCSLMGLPPQWCPAIKAGISRHQRAF